MSRAFETKNPLLNSSDRTKNLKAKTVYSNMVKTANICPTNSAGANYTGTLRFNRNGNMTNYRSYELANTMGVGAAFVWDNCCQGLSGIGNVTIQQEGLETWNISGTLFDWKYKHPQLPDASGRVGDAPLGYQYWVSVGQTGLGGESGVWMPDHLDNAGVSGAAGGTLDGSGIWIDPSNNLFGSITDCEIDLWKKFVRTQTLTAYPNGNNTKKNYLVGYQQVGGNKHHVKPWSLKNGNPSYRCCTGTYYHGLGSW